jgi:hypothetical protein
MSYVNQYKNPNTHKGIIPLLPISISSLTTKEFSISFICFLVLFLPPISKVISFTIKSPCLKSKLILVLSKILGDKISNYLKSGNDRKLIEIVDNIDEKLNKNMSPVEYGKEFIKKISEII